VSTLSHDIESRLLRLIQEDLLQTPAGFNADTDLFASGLDSMAIMQLLLLVEEEFQVIIPVESVSRENFKTTRAVAALIRERQGDGGGKSGEAAPEIILPLTEEVPVVVDPVQGSFMEAAFETLPLQETDYFVAGFDQTLRAAKQGGHTAHSVLELETLPDVESLVSLITRLPEDFPILTARVRRPWLVGLPQWQKASKPHALMLGLWSQEGSAGILERQGATTFSDVASLMEDIINTDLPHHWHAWENVRFHLIEKADGGVSLVFSWSHLILDGVGAELFLQEMVRLAGGSSYGRLPPYSAAAAADTRGWGERYKTVPPMVWRFYELLAKPFGCLGSRKFVPGRTHYQVVTLTREQTAEVARRAAAVSGPMINMPFHLACAMRAHWRVFQHRGTMPESLMACVPIQVRKKGAPPPVFQNHITMFFGMLDAGELETLDGSAKSLKEQHERFLRDRLGDAFLDMMWLMRPLPPRQHIQFIHFQMKGLYSSFYHSNTGVFAPEMDTFLGARIGNAYHIPGISNPPGTGIFANEKHGRLVLTLCWKEGALSKEEQSLFMGQLFADMGVE